MHSHLDFFLCFAFVPLPRFSLLILRSRFTPCHTEDALNTTYWPLTALVEFDYLRNESRIFNLFRFDWRTKSQFLYLVVLVW